MLSLLFVLDVRPGVTFDRSFCWMLICLYIVFCCFSTFSLAFINCNRGNLNLTLLPTSDLRFSFIGDDGHTERLLTLSNSQCSAVVVEEIPADMSGRSFLIKIPDGEVLYFWCSEKSKLLGNELLTKVYLRTSNSMQFIYSVIICLSISSILYNIQNCLKIKLLCSTKIPYLLTRQGRLLET